jgi:hypothetical protein
MRGRSGNRPTPPDSWRRSSGRDRRNRIKSIHKAAVRAGFTIFVE